jgi:hypothetical protein
MISWGLILYRMLDLIFGGSTLIYVSESAFRGVV